MGEVGTKLSHGLECVYCELVPLQSGQSLRHPRGLLKSLRERGDLIHVHLDTVCTRYVFRFE